MGETSGLNFIFRRALIFICFVGQDPPSLRTIGEVAPENVYSDRAFQYLSEVRKAEAEEWIRSSTPREFARNFAGEEMFSKALIRLEDGLLTIKSLPDDAKEAAILSLVNELEANFNLSLDLEEFRWIQNWRSFSEGQELFSFLKKILGKLHLRGVVKFPSTDQKFISRQMPLEKLNLQ